MPAQYLGRADDIEIVGGEDGFELHIGVSLDGNRYVVNVQAVAEQLLEQAKVEIGSWVYEGWLARRSRPLRDDPDAYAADDPKHPDWHSVHADLLEMNEQRRQS